MCGCIATKDHNDVRKSTKCASQTDSTRFGICWNEKETTQLHQYDQKFCFFSVDRQKSVFSRSFSHLDYGDVAYLTVINRIANVHPSVPGLTQDDSHISYCNADKLPKTCDIGLDNRTVCQCSHLIELELGQVYELLLVNKDRRHFFYVNQLIFSIHFNQVV